MEKIPAAPSIFKKLMWVNFGANALVIAYGVATLDTAIFSIGIIGEIVFATLSKLGAA
ncbi:MAG: hypothetical protein KGI38_03720 [Thaumarchaeota archaeon]|nr:hypothetical protein [Nitrososphaerota archaeon]